ncbi:DUF4097 family beta strand repeat-containing protein [Tahibacter amnicola]|uniref:DUF4097 domain-containing protein n=1 Tax=Tahibacter amnicola TaxID=2976241 RepID=A0ABY6BC52_9GAMM|nr:DUF4097 domain-containing protein [Tahibacter amnicola]UXI67626.1 DUF4097 domain-containing protein [Tahibacter amnicola]
MKFIFIPMLALLAPALAQAGTPINETRAVDAAARIEIHNIKGEVNVTGWDKPEVAITGTLGDGAKRLGVDGSGSHLEIRVEGPDKSSSWFGWGADTAMGDTILNIKVPRKASVEIGVVSAAVVVSDLSGGELQIDSVSGRIRTQADASRLRIESVSGDVSFDGKAGETEVETVSGDVVARGVGGHVRVETVSGTLDILANAPMDDVTAGSVSGDIELRGSLAGAGRIHVETMSGDVKLGLRGDLAAKIEAETFSGTLRSDFGTVEKPEHGPGSSLEATVGGGSGRVEIDAFSGDVSITRE